MELLKNLVVLALFAFFLSRVIESSLKLHDPKIAVSLKRVRNVVLKLMFLTQNWTKLSMFLQYKVGKISLNCNMCGQFVVHQCLTIWWNRCWCRGIQRHSVLSRGQAVLFQWNWVGVVSHGLLLPTGKRKQIRLAMAPKVVKIRISPLVHIMLCISTICHPKTSSLAPLV